MNFLYSNVRWYRRPSPAADWNNNSNANHPMANDELALLLGKRLLLASSTATGAASSLAVPQMLQVQPQHPQPSRAARSPVTPTVVAASGGNGQVNSTATYTPSRQQQQLIWTLLPSYGHGHGAVEAPLVVVPDNGGCCRLCPPATMVDRSPTPPVFLDLKPTSASRSFEPMKEYRLFGDEEPIADPWSMGEPSRKGRPITKSNSSSSSSSSCSSRSSSSSSGSDVQVVRTCAKKYNNRKTSSPVAIAAATVVPSNLPRSPRFPVSRPPPAEPSVRDANYDKSKCWNCQLPGHIYKNCLRPVGLRRFCFGCGRPNVTKKSCNDCSKRHLRDISAFMQSCVL